MLLKYQEMAFVLRACTALMSVRATGRFPFHSMQMGWKSTFSQYFPAPPVAEVKYVEKNLYSSLLQYFYGVTNITIQREPILHHCCLALCFWLRIHRWKQVTVTEPHLLKAWLKTLPTALPEHSPLKFQLETSFFPKWAQECQLCLL